MLHESLQCQTFERVAILDIKEVISKSWDELTDENFYHSKILFELPTYWDNMDFLTSEKALIIKF